MPIDFTWIYLDDELNEALKQYGATFDSICLQAYIPAYYTGYKVSVAFTDLSDKTSTSFFSNVHEKLI